MSPTQRTLAELKARGVVAGVVEKWNQYARIRQDLLGFIDIVACMDGITGIQATSGTNVAARIAKIMQEPRRLAWLESGGRIEVWGWRKLKVKRGGKAMRWELRVERIEA